jgi:hypothetical protein
MTKCIWGKYNFIQNAYMAVHHLWQKPPTTTINLVRELKPPHPILNDQEVI